MLVCILCGRVIAKFTPKVHYACCSHCDVTELTDHQKKVIARVNKFASTGKIKNNS